MKKSISKIFSVVCSAAFFPGMLNMGYVSAMGDEKEDPKAAEERPASTDDELDLMRRNLTASRSATEAASLERDAAVKESEKEAEVIKKLDERLQKSRSAMEGTKTLLRNSLGNVRRRRLTPESRPGEFEASLNSIEQKSTERNASLEKTLKDMEEELAKAVRTAEEEEKVIESLEREFKNAESVVRRIEGKKTLAETDLMCARMERSVSGMEKMMYGMEKAKAIALSLEANNRLSLVMRAECLAIARKQVADKAVELAKARLGKEMCDAILQESEAVKELNRVHLRELRAEAEKARRDVLQARFIYDDSVRKSLGKSSKEIDQLLSELREAQKEKKEEREKVIEELKKVEVEFAQCAKNTEEARKNAEESRNKLIEAEEEKEKAKEKVKKIEGNHPEELVNAIEDAKKGKLAISEDQIKSLIGESQASMKARKSLFAGKIWQIVRNRRKLAHSESAEVILNDDGTVDFENFVALFIFNLEKLFKEKFGINLLGSDNQFVDMIVDDMFMQEYDYLKGLYYKFIESSINAAEKILFKSEKKGCVEYFGAYGEFFKSIATLLDAISTTSSDSASVINLEKQSVNCIVRVFDCINIPGGELSIGDCTEKTKIFESFASVISEAKAR